MWAESYDVLGLIAQVLRPVSESGPNPFLAIRLIMYFGLIIACAYTDLTEGKVYNWVTLPAIPLALIARYGERMSFYDVKVGFMAAVFCFFIFFVIWAIGALSNRPLMGGGDVKLMTAIGALTSFPFCVNVIAYTSLVAAIMAIWVLFSHGEVWAGMVGSFRRLFWPSHPSEVSPAERRATSRTISFCTAICVGGMLAMYYHAGELMPHAGLPMPM